MSYEDLKKSVEKSVSGLVKQFDEAKRQLAAANKRLINEKNLLGRLGERKTKLNEHAIDSLASDNNAYLKFKTSLKKLNAEIESTSDAIKALADTVIPNAKTDVTDTRRKLEAALLEIYRSQKPDCESRMTALIDKLVSERDSFIANFKKIYEDFGVRLVVHDINLIPQPKHERIDRVCKGFVITGRSA